MLAKTVAACMIVKNEEKLLPQCLESIKDVVDAIILVDTGSTDRTMEIAKEYGCIIHEHPWQDDYSEARNYALAKVPLRYDRIFVIDADEKLYAEDKELFRQAVQADARMVKFRVYSETAAGMAMHWMIRIWDNGFVHYRGRKHNQICYHQACIGGLSEARLHHYGYNLSREAMEKKWKEAARLIRLQLEDEPDNAFYHANLIQVYRCQEKWQEIADIFESFRAKKGGRKELLRMTLDYIFALIYLKRFDDACSYCTRYLNAEPDDIDAWYYMGLITAMQERYAQCLLCFDKYLKLLSTAKSRAQDSNKTVYTWGAETGAFGVLGRVFYRGIMKKKLSIVDLEKG